MTNSKRYVKQKGSAERYLDTESGTTISKRQYLNRQRGGITVEQYAKKRKQIQSYQKPNAQSKKRTVTRAQVLSNFTPAERKKAWWSVILSEADSKIFIDNGMNPKDVNNPKKRLEFYKQESEVVREDIGNRARTEYETNEDYERKRAIRKEEEQKEREERMRKRKERMDKQQKLS